MRNIVKYNLDLFSDIPTFFDDRFTRDLFYLTSTNDSPPINISENNNTYEIEIAAPGMSRNCFEIKFEGGLLILRSKADRTALDRNINYLRREFNYKNFSRSFNFPENLINPDSINVNYKDGIVFISFRKTISTAKFIDVL